MGERRVAPPRYHRGEAPGIVTDPGAFFVQGHAQPGSPLDPPIPIVPQPALSEKRPQGEATPRQVGLEGGSEVPELLPVPVAAQPSSASTMRSTSAPPSQEPSGMAR